VASATTTTHEAMTHDEAPPPAPGSDAVPRLFRADLAVGRGQVRAWTVLVLRALRAASILLIVLGVTISALTNRLQDTEGLTTTSGLLAAATTPLAVLAAGIVLRLALGPLAFLAALEVVTRDGLDLGLSRPGRRSTWSRLSDRLRLASGVQSLRWTLAVRQEASTRLGPSGRVTVLLELGLRLASVAAAVAMLGALARLS
jgi:hypothetical protein